MDIAALIISGLAAVIAGLGTLLSNKRSKEALQQSRKAVTTSLWSAAQEAVQRLIGFDPTMEPVGERLANLRIATIDLADEYTDWDGLDVWLEAERVLGATLGRQVMDAAEPGDTVEQRLERLDPLMTWALALSQNLRLFRAKGYDGPALLKLRAHAEELVKDIHERHGWQLPPTSNPRLKTLD
ncbi:hypothetical protein NQ156_06840 [Microbacterium sp. zg.Y625]|uniref:hypothetical protein n=1 Tax=Microbacterium jiangjiandongii TaxID=3049071 RepID=UPI00214ADD02|nr:MULTISPECIES: hypothetical protein [unclassified Microbacterium]MCR2792778.1 hypothetical protein [Microbacterium sp. zg.Y625]WIM26754.1 hypothetical protein QNO14_06865 [Microbacterium sp. zg-Y625]